MLKENKISSTYFVEQTFSHDVQIYLHLGLCQCDGEFFGLNEARVLFERRLKDSPYLNFETPKECSDQTACHFWKTVKSPQGTRFILRLRLNESKDRITYITINSELADAMAESFIKLHKGEIDATTFRDAFFTPDVDLDVENELGKHTLNSETLLGQLETLKSMRTGPPRFHFTSRRECIDRKEDCDYESVYRFGDETIIFWTSLTPSGDKIKKGVIRRQKLSFQ